jgi:hypothetical protein
MAVDYDEARILAQWSERLAAALQILDLEVDQELLLDLARKSASSVVHAAAPVTTFMVGYAAGLESRLGSGEGPETSAAAVSRAADVAFRLCEEGRNYD